MLDDGPPQMSTPERREQLDGWLAQLDAPARPTLGRRAQAQQNAWLAQSLVTT